MKASTEFIPFKQVWMLAIASGVVLGLPLAFFARQAPWLIAIPIIFGTLFVVWKEFCVAPEPAQKELPLVTLPSSFLGLARFGGHVALSRPVEKDIPEQAAFDFLGLPRRKPVQPVRVIQDPETGERIYLIDTERFMALLLKNYLPTTDKTTEVSLTHALHRYGEMEAMSNELEKFLRSKTVSEVIKSDFKGNAAQMLNRSSESAIRELIKQTQETKQPRLIA